jgi:hypothetical protein
VAVTYDESDLRIYVDGEEESVVPLSFSIASNHAHLFIGARAGGGEAFTGILDEIRLYRRALDPVEIQSQAASAPLPDGPVGHWQMNEQSGPRILDLSGNGNDGDLTGPPVRVAGVEGLALDFSGDGTHAVIPDDATLDIADEITIAAWIRPRDVGTQRLVRKTEGATGYDLFLSALEYVSIRFNGTNTLRVDSDTLYSSRLGEWIHVAATYDGARIRMYIDGEEDASEPEAFTIDTNDEELRFGADTSCEDAYDGGLDDVRIYGRALTAGEILTLACVSTGQTLSISGAERDSADNVVFSIGDPGQPEDSVYNVFRSSDPTIPYEDWPLAERDIADADPGTAGIQWVDASGDLSPSGIWHYRVVGCETL